VKRINDVYDKLRQTRLFQDFSQKEIEMIASAGTIAEVDTGTVLLSEGDESNTLLILLEGEAEIVKCQSGSKLHRLGLVGQGVVLGEIGMLLDVPRTGTVRTVSPCQIFMLTREAFYRILEQDNSTSSKLCLPIAKTLADRLQKITREVVNVLAQNEALLELLERLQNKDEYSTSDLGEMLLKKTEALRAHQNELKQKLCIEIDESRKARQVEEITKTAYFQQLRKKVKALKRNNLSEDNK
jgi:CRP/FNR family transcriptional regulator, cyclic AMP receptor protein